MNKLAFNISNILLPVTLGGIMVASQGCSKKAIPVSSRWQDAPLKIDGFSNDWEQVPRFYDRSVKLSYDVLNDDKNIYVILKAVDRDLQTKILRNGFDIWIDTVLGKNRQVMGLRFPLPVNERMIQPESQGEGNGGQKTDIREMRRNFSRNVQEMDVIGLAGGKSARTTNQNPYGVDASLNIDKEGTLIYEAAIPIRSIFKDTVLSDLIAKKIRIVLMSNKPEAKEHKGAENDQNSGGGMGGSGNGMGGMGGGGMGGMHGGGMGGGMGGGGRGGGYRGGSVNPEDLDNQVNISLDVTLSATAQNKL